MDNSLRLPDFGGLTVDTRSRLYRHIYDLCALSDCEAVALTSLSKGTYNPGGPGGTLRVACLQFDAYVHLPYLSTLENALRDDVPMPPITIGVEARPQEIAEKERELVRELAGGWRSMKKIQNVLNHAAGGEFIQYYEANVDWIIKNITTDKYRFPAPWDFARVVRNGIGHGRINIDNPNTPSVRWHHLEYGPQQNGKRILDVDFGLPDILFLMAEMDRALSAAGCHIRAFDIASNMSVSIAAPSLGE